MPQGEPNGKPIGRDPAFLPKGKCCGYSSSQSVCYMCCVSHSSMRRGQRISNPPVRFRVRYETSGYAAKRSCSGFLTRQMQVRVLLLPLIKASSNGGAAVSDADIVQGQVRVISNHLISVRIRVSALHGVLAHSGERLFCKQKAAGSKPASSISNMSL